ncbi:hypothetical protein [Brevibacterium ihuae]|uniref:hypothetical protein n=1 Tax=Brevibacterium ihuae TaxID=1631743 RepID=UPI000C77BCE0|nr:hypothetical protein [Brevibacterium ihuae]
MFVLTIDQRRSRSTPDAVPGLLAALDDLEAAIPFARTVGDEIQGVLTSPEVVVDAVLRAAHPDRWSIGIGLGGVESPLPAHSRDARGDAFVRARQAVEEAKEALTPLALRGEPAPSDAPITAADAQTALRLLVRLIGACTEVQWTVISAALADPALTQRALADRLDVSQQFVSKTLRVGAADLIADAVALCTRLLAAVHEPGESDHG